MRRRLLLFFVPLLLSADTFKLYLKDGSYQVTREYSIQGERIHYFSTERGEWEDIPKDMVDLDRTEKEHHARDAEISTRSKEEAEEEQAERDQRREIAAVPMEPGAYYKSADKYQPLPSAPYQVVTNKKRKALQVLSPIPILPGKASVVIEGPHSKLVMDSARPEFFVRLDREQRFGIVSLTTKKTQRIVENISIVPVANIPQEIRNQMDTFDQDLGNGLFKVWPEKNLQDGEYALIEFAEKNDINDIDLVIWDFAVHTGEAP